MADVLPEFRPIRFGFVKTDDWIASGFYVDSSAFSSSAFYVQAFAMPRFVPADSIYFDCGFRVKGRWEEVGPELAHAVAAAKPELTERATLTGLIAATSDWQRNINHAEVRLCAATILEDDVVVDEVRRTLSDFVPEVPWEADVRDRCLKVLRLVDAGGYAAGQEELAGRRQAVDRLLA